MRKSKILELLAGIPHEHDIDLVVWDGNDSWTAKELKLNDSYSSGIIELEMVLDDNYTVKHFAKPTHEVGHSIAKSMNDPSPMQEKAYIESTKTNIKKDKS